MSRCPRRSARPFSSGRPDLTAWQLHTQLLPAITRPSGVNESPFDEAVSSSMGEFQIGDRVTFCSRATFVRGFSPISVAPSTIHLEDAETGTQLEVTMDELAGNMPRDGHSSGSEDNAG